MGKAPNWENYVVAQTVQATLGLVPPNALAVGVQVNGRNVRVRFQLSRLTEQDTADMDDIVDGPQDLVGDRINVEHDHEVREQRVISPHDGFRWVFLARA